MMKKILFLTITLLLTNNLFAEETYSDYLKRKEEATKIISGKFKQLSDPALAGKYTFSEAHINCTKELNIVSEKDFSGSMTAEQYNTCMGKYYPYLEDVDPDTSCAAQSNFEWGDITSKIDPITGTLVTYKCSADIPVIGDGSTYLAENDKTIVNQEKLQGFAKLTCRNKQIEIVDSKCTLLPEPCKPNDTIGDPSYLDSRYKLNDNWRQSHLWPITQPEWAVPNAPSYVVPDDPKGIDRSKEFADKVNNGEREFYCRATLDNTNAGTTGAQFDIKSGDQIVNPKIDNNPAFFEAGSTNSIWRCFDGEFYKESATCQYKAQSCKDKVVSVGNGKGKNCSFQLKQQPHGEIYVARNPLPENSVGYVKAFCWDGEWEIWEESCSLSCESTLSNRTWEHNASEPEQCAHGAKNFGSRTKPSDILTIDNENIKMNGSVSYLCDNGDWKVESEFCKPKSCTNLGANSWNVNGAVCSHNSLNYVLEHNEKIKTVSTNPTNEAVGAITYQCRYGNFVDVTGYNGDPEYAPLINGTIPQDKNCINHIMPPCYFDENKNSPTPGATNSFETGDGCMAECSINFVTGKETCIKFCPTVLPPQGGCNFPGGYAGCPAEGRYSEGYEMHCPLWREKPQVCTNGVWVDKNIPAKQWMTKTVVSFSEIYTEANIGHLYTTKPIVEVSFGRVLNPQTMQNEYGYTNVNSYQIDKAVKSGTGSEPCTIESRSYSGVLDTSHTCFVKAQQSGVKDWAVFYTGNCTLSGAASGEYTTNNIRVNCALDITKNQQNELQYNPKSANVIFIIRYNDGTTLSSPNISILTNINATTPSGYCAQIAPVTNIANGASGLGCENTLTLQNALQSGKTQNINQSSFVYINGVCYKVNYTGTLNCTDSNADPFVETLNYTGNLSCVNEPVASFNCGVSEAPKWKFAEVSSFTSKLNVTNDIVIPQPNNSGVAYTVNGLAISNYNESGVPASCSGDSCTAALNVSAGNEIQAFMIEQLSNTSDCKIRNTSNTVDLSINTWYSNTGASIYCEKAYSGGQVADYNASVKINYRLKDNTLINGKVTQINYKEAVVNTCGGEYNKWEDAIAGTSGFSYDYPDGGSFRCSTNGNGDESCTGTKKPYANYYVGNLLEENMNTTGQESYRYEFCAKTAKVCKEDSTTYITEERDDGGAGQDSNWSRTYLSWTFENKEVYSSWDDETGSSSCRHNKNCSGNGETGYRFYDNPNYRHIVYDDNFQYYVESGKICREARIDTSVNWKVIYSFDAYPYGYYSNRVNESDWVNAKSVAPSGNCTKGDLYKQSKSTYTSGYESKSLTLYKCF